MYTPLLDHSFAYCKQELKTLDFLHNPTCDGNLYVDSVLDSSGTSEYPADLRSESPSNSLPQAGSARSLLYHRAFKLCKCVSLFNCFLNNNYINNKLLDGISKAIYNCLGLPHCSKWFPLAIYYTFPLFAQLGPFVLYIWNIPR